MTMVVWLVMVGAALGAVLSGWLYAARIEIPGPDRDPELTRLRAEALRELDYIDAAAGLPVQIELPAVKGELRNEPGVFIPASLDPRPLIEVVDGCGCVVATFDPDGREVPDGVIEHAWDGHSIRYSGYGPIREYGVTVREFAYGAQRVLGGIPVAPNPARPAQR